MVLLNEYKTLTDFESAQLAGEINNDSIYFIVDIQAIFARGNYYGISASAGSIAVTGFINMTSSTSAQNAYKSLQEDGTASLYIIGDSSGNYPTSSMAVNVSADVMKIWAAYSPNSAFNALLQNYITADAQSFNVGDILCVARMRVSADSIISAYGLNSTQAAALKLLGSSFSICQYRVLSSNDCKAAGSYGATYGTMGLMTPNDKKVLNDALPKADLMPSRSESNMNNALDTGVYPWCTLGRPTGSTGAYTCIVHKSSTTDGNGYYTIEQIAYGRQDELGKIYKRIIFKKSDGSSTEYGDWIDITGGGSSVINTPGNVLRFTMGYIYEGAFNAQDIEQDVQKSFDGHTLEEVCRLIMDGKITTITNSNWYQKANIYSCFIYNNHIQLVFGFTEVASYKNYSDWYLKEGQYYPPFICSGSMYCIDYYPDEDKYYIKLTEL